MRSNSVTEENKTELARFLKRLDQLAFNDVRKMFDAHGNPIEIKDLPDDVAPSIAGFKFTEEYGSKKSEGQEGEGKVAVGYTKEFKLVNPLDAIMAYGKARNLYTDKNEKPKNALEEAATKTMVAMLAMIESQALERAREANA